MPGAQSNEFAEPITWRAGLGEHPTTIKGWLTRVSAFRGSFGRYPVIEIKEDSGRTWNVHVLHDVLKGELQDLRPQIGDQIEITYRGKTDRGYFGYRVRFVDGSSGQIDWSRFDDEPAGQEALPIADQPSTTAPPAGERQTDPGETDDVPF
jgi:hypothetical protein